MIKSNLAWIIIRFISLEILHWEIESYHQRILWSMDIYIRNSFNDFFRKSFKESLRNSWKNIPKITLKIHPNSIRCLSQILEKFIQKYSRKPSIGFLINTSMESFSNYSTISFGETYIHNPFRYVSIVSFRVPFNDFSK